MLYKISTTPEKQMALLATGGMCRQDYYPLPLKLCRTSGSIKTYFTMSNKCFIPNLIHYL